MAKAQYIGVGNIARKVKKQYIGVGGIARKIKKGYIGVGGVARQYWSSDSTIKITGTDSITVSGTSKKGCYLGNGVGTSYYSGDVLSLAPGSTISCRVEGHSTSYPGKILLNGTVVASGVTGVLYTYTVTEKDATINMATTSYAGAPIGTITITEN